MIDLDVEVEKVESVLIGGERMFVMRGSFLIGRYGFSSEDEETVFSGLGYSFCANDNTYYYGPIEAIQMVEVSG